MKEIVENIEKKVTKFISLYHSVQEERNDILKQNGELKSEISEKDIAIKKLEEKIKLLRITKSVSAQELESSKESRKKINEYVREIDKCIALLNK